MIKIILKFFSTVILMGVIIAFFKALFVVDEVDVLYLKRLVLLFIISSIGTIGYYLNDDD